MQSWKKNPSVNEAWQNDKNGCNRHRCKESRYLAGCSVLEPEDFSCRPRCRPACSGGSPTCPGEGKVSIFRESPLPELTCGAAVRCGCSWCRQEGSGVPCIWVLLAEGHFSPRPPQTLPPQTHTLPAPCRCQPLRGNGLAGTQGLGWRAIAPVGWGCLPEGMAHCSFQIKLEPQAKQSQWKLLGGLRNAI